MKPTQGTGQPTFESASSTDRKRKRLQEIEASQKRQQVAQADHSADKVEQSVFRTTLEENVDPIAHWVQKGRWSEQYFELNSQDRESLNKYLCLQNYLDKQEEIWMAHSLARTKSTDSLRRKQFESSNASDPTTSDQQPRENKSRIYKTAKYATILATKGSFMDKSFLGITDASKTFCKTLLNRKQTIPQNTLFRDDLFDETCRKLQDRNEAMIIRDLALLIVPSAQTLATYGATSLKRLIESVNEGWNSAIPIYGPRPQPDYSVGFGRSAFTNERLDKLRPLVGKIEDLYTSFFMGTWRMYFPFLTCEVKCGAAALDVADRQNAHSMTIAVRAVFELFRYVKREKEIDREILAFSISHDHECVRIYGHYPLIDGEKPTFYRHPIRKFDFTEQNGREKWTTYKFTKNVYDVWMPKHFERICSAIDDLPSDLNFNLSQQSELQYPDDAKFQLSQELEATYSQQSNIDSIAGLEEDDSLPASQESTQRTFVTHREESQFKKPKKKRAAGQ